MASEKSVQERLTETGSKVFEQLDRMRKDGQTPNAGAAAALETAVQALALAEQLLSVGTARVHTDSQIRAAEHNILRKSLETAAEGLDDLRLDPATAILIQSTKTLLAASASVAAVNQCEEGDTYEPMWQVRRNGKIIWTCGHQPPHESDA